MSLFNWTTFGVLTNSLSFCSPLLVLVQVSFVEDVVSEETLLVVQRRVVPVVPQELLSRHKAMDQVGYRLTYC